MYILSPCNNAALFYQVDLRLSDVLWFVAIRYFFVHEICKLIILNCKCKKLG
jgi:hypothetical protein